MLSLVEFLDAGGDVTKLDRWKRTVESARGALTSAPGYRSNEAKTWRHMAEMIASGSPFGIPMADGTVSSFDPGVAQLFLWDAEMLEDPTLAGRLIASLPEPARGEALQELDESRRPHPISVEVPAEGLQWACENCGEAHDVGDGVLAVVIGYREGYSALDDDRPLAFCGGCIAIAAAVASPAGFA